MGKQVFYLGVLALALAYLVVVSPVEGQFFGKPPREVTFPSVPSEYGEVFHVHEWTDGETYESGGDTYHETYRAVWYRDTAGTIRRSVFQHDLTDDRAKSRVSTWKVIEIYPRK